MLTRKMFSWYLFSLITVGVIILGITFFLLRPYLSRIDIFALNYTSQVVSPPLPLPTLSLLTPTSAQITFTHPLQESSALHLGTSPTQLNSSFSLGLLSTITLTPLLPRTHYYFQINNSPIYSFVTPTHP